MRLRPLVDEPMAARRMSRFLAHLSERDTFKGKPLTAGVADTCLMALGSFWNNNNVSFVRKHHPGIAQQMKGFRRKKPSSTRIKKPFTIHHLQFAVDFLLKQGSIDSMTLATALTMAYWWGLRGGEYTCTKTTLKLGDVALLPSQFDFFYNREGGIISMVINIQKSKINQPTVIDRVEQVEARCACPGVCGPHMVKRLIDYKEQRGAFSEDLPFLTFSDGRPIHVDFVNRGMKAIVVKMGLAPVGYAAQSARSGRATDMTIHNVQSFYIAKWGRWKSDCWMKHYAKIDHSDIARITHTTMQDLLLLNPRPARELRL